MMAMFNSPVSLPGGIFQYYINHYIHICLAFLFATDCRQIQRMNVLMATARCVPCRLRQNINQAWRLGNEWFRNWGMRMGSDILVEYLTFY